MRNQIPGLFEDLDWQVQARSNRDSAKCLLPENEQLVTEKLVGYMNSMQLILAGVWAPARAASWKFQTCTAWISSRQCATCRLAAWCAEANTEKEAALTNQPETHPEGRLIEQVLSQI